MQNEFVSKNNYKYLNTINSPQDVKKLSPEEMPVLAEEIREFLVDNVSKTGGHLASNLGAVELTLAIHKVFDSPRDNIIFDVGHQSYIHKILTGRRERFDTLRQGGGLSGFMKMSESEHDCFGSGHSSTSLSAALGFAEANRILGLENYTIAVVGDGAFTGGMIHEALNNCKKDLKLVIILNENEMSISKNIGSFAKNLSKLRAGKKYLSAKSRTVSAIKNIPMIGDPVLSVVKGTKKVVKNALYGSNYFEDLGLYYLGPVDGNDYEKVENLLYAAKNCGQSVIVHVKTVKGKGYSPAESDPASYHSVPLKDPNSPPSYSEKCGEILTRFAESDKKMCAITAAMSTGTGLEMFAKKIPERFFDVGIAEAHALTFAAGLAASGMRPVAAIYSSFLQRGYDSIIHDIALQSLPVVICVDRAGLSANDGATHHGLFDVAFFSHIPNMKIYTPACFAALERSLEEAFASDLPSAVRYPSGKEIPAIKNTFYSNEDKITRSLGIVTDFSSDFCPQAIIITHGRITEEAIKARDMLNGKVNVGIMLLEYLKPYEHIADKIASILPNSVSVVIFLEEEIKNGGMGMILSNILSPVFTEKNIAHAIMAVDDNFAQRNENIGVYESAGISHTDIENKICSLL